ncbi:hypothetical protein [Acidovorax sp. Root219]|uniref:hypothetical protein n=1 Tax=Acidovorax sp. Root219 TaxID=1736493 RepID=UPI0012F89B80|nr:hypothetical protein [Acidovorax sp. Root219]
MKPTSTVLAQLLESLAKVEYRLAEGAVLEKRPSITIDMTKVSTVSKERWESLGKAARDPTIKLHGQAIISVD